MLKLFCFPWYCSFVVDPKHYSCAEQTFILVSKRGKVVVRVIPQAFGSYPDSLSTYLSYHCLHNYFIGRNVESLHSRFYLICQALSKTFGGCMIVLFIFQISQHHFLYACPHLRRIEPKDVNSYFLQSYLSFSLGSSL